MATNVGEHAPFREGWVAVVSLALVAVIIVLGLGIRQLQPAAERAPGVEKAEAFSPEAARIRNAASLHVREAFSPEVVRMTNTGAPSVREAFSPELIRITNLAGANEREAFSPEVVRMRNEESFVLYSN